MSIPHTSTRPVREIIGPLRTHPWQDGPAELIAHGLQHMLLNREDFDRHMAFLLFDVGVEALFKTFLLLDKGASGADGNYSTRNKAATSESFHDIVEGTRAAAPDRLTAVDADHIRHYHDIRNRLYHRGNGITVSEHHVQEYGRLAVHLLQALLNIDLRGMIEESVEAKYEREAIADKKQSLQAKVDEIDELANEIVAHLAPRLLTKRTWRRFEETFRGQIFRSGGEMELLGEEKIRGRTHQTFGSVEIPATPGLLMATTNEFFDSYIADPEVKSYFLNLTETERKSVITDVFDEQWGDPDSEYSPFSRSLELLGHWPDLPFYDHLDWTIGLAQNYPESPDLGHEIWDDNHRVIGFYDPSLEEYLTYADQLMGGLDQGIEYLADWLENRTSGNWSEADA